MYLSGAHTQEGAGSSPFNDKIFLLLSSVKTHRKNSITSFADDNQYGEQDDSS